METNLVREKEERYKELKIRLLKKFVFSNLSNFKKPVEDSSRHLFQLWLRSGILDSLDELSYKLIPIIFQGLESQPEVDHSNMDEVVDLAYSYLIDAFPVFKRWLKVEVDNSFQNFHVLCKRLESDLNVGMSQVKRIEFGLGDRHRGGRSVAIVELDNRKLIYKPRDLSIDMHFSQLLQAIDKGTRLGFKTPNVIQKKNYGWVEYIDHEECKSQSDVFLFYKRLGGLLAILYALEATDFHYENIIAHGSIPVLIDLESFFHPYKPIEEAETNEGIDKSVLRTGILPSAISIDDTDEIDISGTSNVDGKQGLLANLRIGFSNSGELEYKRKKGTLIGGKNIPSYNGEKIEISKEYLPEFISGFEQTYLFLMENKKGIGSDIVKYFKGDQVRVLFRHTVTYKHLLEESTHPQILKDKKELENLFDWLKIVIPDYKIAGKFVQFEIDDLMRRDVPLFTTKTDSRHLWYSEDSYLPDFFDKTGLETVVEKIEGLSEIDMQQQKWIIKASFDLKENSNIVNVSSNKEYPTKLRYENTSVSDDALEKELISTTHKIAQFVMKSINTGNSKYVNWLVIKPENLEGNKFTIAEAFYDLYGGMPGEILFLSYYGKIFHCSEALDIATKAMDYLVFRLNGSKESIKPVGLYAGWGSIIELLNRLYKIHEDEYFLKRNHELLNSIDFESLIKLDPNFGFVKGSAGLIVALVNSYNVAGSTEYLELAELAAKHLLDNQSETKVGTGWKITSEVPLSGLAHGASGFMFAFAKLYAITGKKIYLSTIERLLEYENSLFSEEHMNWRDCRSFILKQYGGEIYCSKAWSHGAGGIGMVRMELKDLGIDNPALDRDLKIAVETTKKAIYGMNHSLTYGDFGNLDVLFNYYRMEKDPEVETFFRSVLYQTLLNSETESWKIGNGTIQSLGLMSGVTGIGYQCLRFLRPDKVPSILVP